jgi:hypothetical protein
MMCAGLETLNKSAFTPIGVQLSFVFAGETAQQDAAHREVE